MFQVQVKITIIHASQALFQKTVSQLNQTINKRNKYLLIGCHTLNNKIIKEDCSI